MFASNEKYSLKMRGQAVFSTLYRHFVFGPYKIYGNFREKSRFILAEVTYIWGDRIEGFNGRPEICLGNDAVIDVINLVFKDTIEKGKEDIRKFTDVYGQQKNVYRGLNRFLLALFKRLNGLAIKNDFQNMNGEELYEILPPYFKGDDSKTPEAYYKENKNSIE